MNAHLPTPADSSEKKLFLWKVSHADTLPAEEVLEILRYALKLADLYEGYILSKGIGYIFEADQYIQEHKGVGFPFL